MNIHATGLVLNRLGVMLRGPSGSGKSLLALSLLDLYEARGLAARLVADDRLDLGVERGKLVMHAPQTIVGLIELRGRGIVSRPHQSPVPLHLVIDLVPELVRMLEEDALVTELAGLPLARAPVPYASAVGVAHQLLLVLEAIRALEGKGGGA